jgi:hypothetical protein
LIYGVERNDLLLKAELSVKWRNFTKTTLEHMRLKDGGLKFIHAVSVVRFRISEVHTWMEEHKVMIVPAMQQ